MGEPTPDTEEDRMAREAREDEEEAARAKALADAGPRTQAMARDMEVMRQLETGGEGVRGSVAEDEQMDDPVGMAHDGEARDEIVIDSAMAEADAAQLRDPGKVPAGDVGDEEPVGSPVAVGGDVETGEDACGEVHGDVGAPSTLPASGMGEGAGVMAPPPIQQDAPTGTHRQRCRRPPGVGTQCTRYVEQPRDNLIFGAMIVDELGACLATDLTETRCGVRIDSKKAKTLLPCMQSVSWGLASPTPPSDASVAVGAMGVGAAQSPPSVARDRGTQPSAANSATGRPRERRQATTWVDASLLGHTDVPWSNTRRSTTATRKRQPGLGRRHSSTSLTREVHAAGFDHRGGSGVDAEGAGGHGSAAPGAQVSTHGLGEVSQILGADVLGPPRTQRPIPRRALHRDGETTEGERLEMTQGRRRMDTLISVA
ncbi:hypothetical protein CBR_g32454 [Chara braunii]|uniref:Uncharacterized protein n=1 Tax=Chara braunii TaxID=69332 RepID=A0A388LGM7_CHABU|nr:hypothetical protein CBR_g32454 [Chara braunii]|eukprot:GBG81464.1 hypothetical protein CBR_g32454 [Chara braunii]